MRYDQLTLSFDHSIVMGNKPESLGLADMTEKGIFNRTEVEAFGLFDSSSPNYTTFYPDLDLSELEPKDEEFIYPVYRLLSAVTLPTYMGPLSFEKPGVLKAAMALMLGQTVNVDHEIVVGNAIGSVVEVAWQNGYTLPNGLKVPPGINGTLKIDGKANPRIARGINMKPPSIHSNSVTVNYAWDKSHPKMSDDEFQRNLGKPGPDGKMVKMVVQEILYFLETSLVPHGRDPFAKKIGANGKIEAPNIADSQAKRIAGMQNSMISYKIPSSPIFVSSESFSDTYYNNEPNTNNMDELIALLAEFNVEATEENAIEVLRSHLGKEDGNPEEVQNLQAQLTERDTEIQSLKDAATATQTEMDALKAEVAQYKESANGNLTATREEAVKFFKLLKGDNADDKIISAINESSPELANSFLKQYKDEFEALAPLTCQDCHSTHVERATATPPNPNTEEKPAKLSSFELRKKIQEDNAKKGLLIMKTE